MTLVVSDVSKFGIVMLADSAVTETWSQPIDLPSGKQLTDVVRIGAQKIVPIEPINAAISIWGFGAIQSSPGNNELRIPVDLFIRDFAELVDAGTSLEEVGNKLADAVNSRIVVGIERGGFHLAGYANQGGKCFPALYHIHTGHDNEPLHELRLYHDFPFDWYEKDGINAGECVDRWLADLEAGSARMLRNGIFPFYAMLWQRMRELMTDMALVGFVCPDYSAFPGRELEVRSRFLKLQLQTICEFFRLSKFPKYIAMPISCITISTQGIKTFEPSAVDLR